MEWNGKTLLTQKDCSNELLMCASHPRFKDILSGISESGVKQVAEEGENQMRSANVSAGVLKRVAKMLRRRLNERVKRRGGGGGAWWQQRFDRHGHLIP